MSKSVLSFLSAAEILVMNQDGTVDVDSTLAKVENQITQEAAEAAEWDSVCAEGLNQVFAEVPAGTCIPENLAINVAMKKLNLDGDIQKMQVATQRFTDFLGRTHAFQSKRGKGGGLFRV